MTHYPTEDYPRQMVAYIFPPADTRRHINNGTYPLFSAYISQRRDWGRHMHLFFGTASAVPFFRGVLRTFSVFACFFAHFRAVLVRLGIWSAVRFSFVFGRFNGLFLDFAYSSTVAPFPCLPFLAFLLRFFGAFRLFSCNLSRQQKKPVLGAIFKAFSLFAFPIPFGRGKSIRFW